MISIEVTEKEKNLITEALYFLILTNMKNPFKKTTTIAPAPEMVEQKNEIATEKWNRYWALKAQKNEIQNALNQIEEEIKYIADTQNKWEGKTARFSENAIRKIETKKLKVTQNFKLEEFFEEDSRFEKYSRTDIDEKAVLSDILNGKINPNEFGFEVKETTTYQFIKN